MRGTMETPKARAQNVILTLSDGREVVGTFQEFAQEGDELLITSVRATRAFDLPDGYAWNDLAAIQKMVKT